MPARELSPDRALIPGPSNVNLFCFWPPIGSFRKQLSVLRSYQPPYRNDIDCHTKQSPQGNIFPGHSHHHPVLVIFSRLAGISCHTMKNCMTPQMPCSPERPAHGAQHRARPPEGNRSESANFREIPTVPGVPLPDVVRPLVFNRYVRRCLALGNPACAP